MAQPRFLSLAGSGGMDELDLTGVLLSVLLSLGEGRTMSEEQQFKAAALGEVNSHILETARDSIGDQQEEWEFFCECGHTDCQAHVELTLDKYTALRDQGGAVLAPGHTPDPLQQARGVREDAQALRAEASQLRSTARKRRRTKRDE